MNISEPNNIKENFIDKITTSNTLNELEPNIKSIISSEMNPEQLRKEYVGMFLAVITSLFRSFGAFYTKAIQQTYPTKFHTIPFWFLRSFTIIWIALFHSWYKDIRILRPSEIPFKKWFIYRTNINFFGLGALTMSWLYLRSSTAQIIISMNPIIVFILSYLILHETFHFRYAVGTWVCIIGSIIIVSNERHTRTNNKINDKESTDGSNTMIGIWFALFALWGGTMVDLSNKILAQNKVPINTQLFYVGLSTWTYSTIFILFFGGVELDLGYLLMCMIHGVFFYCGNVSYNLALQMAPLNKLIILSYLQIVFVFILGYLFLGENIFFTDIVGAGFILSYMMYNAAYPLKKI